MEDKIKDDNWELRRWNHGETTIYEYWHKPIPDIPKGRYIKYTMENDEIIVIEDGPYLG
jgi:hypothetical protein